MRDHLATLLDDFRRYDREIAVVRYQGNRRRVTTYGQLRGWPAALPRCWPSGASGRATACCCGREQRGVDRRLPWLHVARGAGRSSGRQRDRGFCRARGADVAPKLAVGDAAAAAPVACGSLWPPFRPLKIGSARCPPKRPARFRALARDAAPDSVHLRHHRRSQGHCAHPRQRAGQRGPHRGGGAALYALRAADPSAAHSAHAAAEPRLRQTMGLWVPPIYAAELHFEEPPGGAKPH
jgi:hypothetical protein